MTDDITDRFDVFEEPRETAEGNQYATVAPSRSRQKPYAEEVAADFEEQHAYDQWAAKEYGKEALEQLYGNEFPIEDPPDSFERYEAEVALRHLSDSIANMFKDDPHPTREIQVVVDVVGGEIDDITEAPEIPPEPVLHHEAWQLAIEQAKSRIDVMATYGQVAEPYLASLTYDHIHSDVRAYATETLAEIRDSSDGSQSLTAAIRDWWRGAQ